MKKILIFTICLLLISSCIKENEENTWQNLENTNNSDTEGYIERGDEWNFFSWTWASLSGSVILENENTTDENSLGI